MEVFRPYGFCPTFKLLSFLWSIGLPEKGSVVFQNGSHVGVFRPVGFFFKG